MRHPALSPSRKFWTFASFGRAQQRRQALALHPAERAGRSLHYVQQTSPLPAELSFLTDKTNSAVSRGSTAASSPWECPGGPELVGARPCSGHWLWHLSPCPHPGCSFAIRAAPPPTSHHAQMGGGQFCCTSKGQPVFLCSHVSPSTVPLQEVLDHTKVLEGPTAQPRGQELASHAADRPPS